MFSQQQLHTIRDAIDLGIKSNKRALNTSKNPQFTPIYTQILRELEAIDTILITEINKNTVNPNGKK